MPDTSYGMTILHLIDSGGMYGAEQVLLGLAREAVAKGHKVILGSIRLPGEAKKPIESAADGLGLEIWPVTAQRGFDWRAIQSVALAARSKGVDIVHCHGYKANILMGLVGRHSFGRPIITTLHGWTSTQPTQRKWWYALVERQILRRFDAIVAVHPVMTATVRLPRSVRSRLIVIENGIEAVAPTPPPVCPSLQALRAWCMRRPTIGAVGRLSEEKGFDVLIEALGKLGEKNRPPQLAIIGDGPLRSELERQVRLLGLADDVHFGGFVPGASTVLPWFHVLAIPSFTEGLPMVMLEAMRARVPIVATAVGGIPDALQGGAAGGLVPAGDPDSLAAALQQVLSNEQRAATYSRCAFEIFRLRFSQSAMATRYMELYETLKYPGARTKSNSHERSHLVGQD